LFLASETNAAKSIQRSAISFQVSGIRCQQRNKGLKMESVKIRDTSLILKESLNMICINRIGNSQKVENRAL
jgi:hypothetical protein